jgi:hypothetical protein
MPDVPLHDVKELVESDVLSGKNNFSSIAEANALIICAPTPLRKTNEPDISSDVRESPALKIVSDPQARERRLLIRIHLWHPCVLTLSHMRQLLFRRMSLKRLAVPLSSPNAIASIMR